MQPDDARAQPREVAVCRERYESLFSHNPHSIFSLDLDGRYTDANAAGQEMSGWTMDELLGMRFSQVIHEEDMPGVMGHFQAVMSGESRHFEARIRSRDGEVKDLQLTAMPIIVAGEVVGVHGMAEDITDRNRMRRELEEAQRAAEEASEAKSLFLANMSHEVRTPLTTVLGAAEMLEEHCMDAEANGLLEMIRRSGDRLLRLVNDLLDFSRLGAGSLQLVTAPFDVRRMVSDTAEAVAPFAKEKGLAFDWRVSDRVPSEVLGDDLRVGQVLSNLLTNGVKFTSTGQVRLDVDHDETAGLVFAVQDTGQGIDPGKLDSLFRAFTQGDASTTRTYGGAGLGLAICAEVAALMGAQIDVDSTPGAGSTFTFTVDLPACR